MLSLNSLQLQSPSLLLSNAQTPTALTPTAPTVLHRHRRHLVDLCLCPSFLRSPTQVRTLPIHALLGSRISAALISIAPLSPPPPPPPLPPHLLLFLRESVTVKIIEIAIKETIVITIVVVVMAVTVLVPKVCSKGRGLVSRESTVASASF